MLGFSTSLCLQPPGCHLVPGYTPPEPQGCCGISCAEISIMGTMRPRGRLSVTCVPFLQNPSQCPSLSGSSQVSLRKLPAALYPLASKVPEHRLGTTSFILCQLPLHLNESPWVARTLPVRILHNVRHMGVNKQVLPTLGEAFPRQLSQEPPRLLLLPRNTSLPSSKGKPRDGSSSLVLVPHN